MNKVATFVAVTHHQRFIISKVKKGRGHSTFCVLKANKDWRPSVKQSKEFVDKEYQTAKQAKVAIMVWDMLS